MTALAPDRPIRIELICFAALAAVTTLQWTSLVAHPPATRVALAALLATGAGALLATIARLEVSRTARWALATGATVAAILACMVVVGLPARLLLPANWDELGSNISRSLNGVSDVPVPYAGADAWTRLVILLAGPLIAGVAAFAAFWPTRRRSAGRVCALVLLVALYLVAVAWARPGRQLAGGALLLVLTCAWLWLPSIPSRSRTAAGVTVAAAAILAVPVAAAVDTGRGLIDYRHWNLLSANGQSFKWDQTYGPLSWPQKGTLLLEVASEHTHYWKATNLDEFDGTSWRRSPAPSSEPALGEPLKFHPKGAVPRPPVDWIDRINFTNEGLSSDVAIGAGTILSLNRTQGTPAPDGVWSMAHELRPGNAYTATVYDPKPSVAEMRAAGTAFPAEARRYVAFGLPNRLPVQVPFWAKSGPSSVAEQVRGTPYIGMYDLAHRIAAGAGTPYEAARRIEIYLRTHYAYRQNVPNRTYPLPAFLSEDRAGYCQQFSGTMALMLRMLGIPSRVSTGFAPGGRDPERNNFLVDDTDAHDWVEVFFPAIGWVTFEPTPAASPASTQLDDNALGVTKPGPTFDGGDATAVPDLRGGEAPAKKPAQSGGLGGAGGGDSGPSILIFLAGAAGVAALGSLAAYAFRLRRRRLMPPDELADAELGELDRALERIGSPLSPGTTLLGAEELLGGFAGSDAAEYAARLRDGRYRHPGAAPPGVHDRRALRRALLRAAGRRSLLRVLLAVPPGGPSPRTGRGGPTTSR